MRAGGFFSETPAHRFGEAETSYEAALPSNRSLEADMEQAELRERLEHALRALPDHQRVPIVLFHFEQLSYQEISEMSGCRSAS